MLSLKVILSNFTKIGKTFVKKKVKYTIEKFLRFICYKNECFSIKVQRKLNDFSLKAWLKNNVFFSLSLNYVLEIIDTNVLIQLKNRKTVI